MKFSKIILLVTILISMTASQAELLGVPTNTQTEKTKQIVITGLANLKKSIILLSQDDGKTWTAKTDGPAIWTLSYAHKHYIAASVFRLAPELATSTDGISWVLYSTPDLAHRAIWGHHEFFITLKNDCVARSNDEVTWKKFCFGTKNEAAKEAIWTGSQYIVAGSRRIYTSPDGDTWTLRYLTDGKNQLSSDIAWNHANTYVIAKVNQNATSFLTSTDGQNWVEQGLTTRWPIYSITWGKDKFVAVGGRGTILTSLDGIQWTQQLSRMTSCFTRVRWMGHQFVVVGFSYDPSEPSPILTSPDGMQWTWHDSGTTIGLGGVA